MTENAQKITPVDTLRNRGVKLVIWENSKTDGNGVRYSVQIVRSYKDNNGNWNDTAYLNETELLQANLLIPKAYDRIAELRAEHYENQNS